MKFLSNVKLLRVFEGIWQKNQFKTKIEKTAANAELASTPISKIEVPYCEQDHIVKMKYTKPNNW